MWWVDEVPTIAVCCVPLLQFSALVFTSQSWASYVIVVCVFVCVCAWVCVRVCAHMCVCVFCDITFTYHPDPFSIPSLPPHPTGPSPPAFHPSPRVSPYVVHIGTRWVRETQEVEELLRELPCKRALHNQCNHDGSINLISEALREIQVRREIKRETESGEKKER